MHLVNIDKADETGARTYRLRNVVQAVECPEGATVVDDKGESLDTSGSHPCAVLIDATTGDFDLVPLGLFSALYVEDDTSASAQAETVKPADPFAPSMPVNERQTIAADDTRYNPREGQQGSTTTLPSAPPAPNAGNADPAAGNADPAAGNADPAAGNADPAAGNASTESVAALSDTQDAQQAAAQDGGQQ